MPTALRIRLMTMASLPSSQYKMAGLIDLGQRQGERPLIFARRAQPEKPETRHGLLAVDRLEDRLRFAATICPGDGILSQEAGQSRHVPGLTGGKKTEQK